MLETQLVSKGLSQKEILAVEYVFKGMSNKEVADAMNVKIKTVKFHLTNVYRKIGVKSRLQLVTLFADVPEMS